jgi:hypothetical protein
MAKASRKLKLPKAQVKPQPPPPVERHYRVHYRHIPNAPQPEVATEIIACNDVSSYGGMVEFTRIEGPEREWVTLVLLPTTSIERVELED